MLTLNAAAPAEIFSIGTEVVLGRIQDTNSSWLAERIVAGGGDLARITAVRDVPDEVESALRDAIDRGAGLIVTTGGLGPTPDDLTVEIVAGIAGCGVRSDEAVIADYRERRQIPAAEELNPSMIKMGTVPEAAHVFINPVGWAPGFAVEVDGSVLFCMPGPPREVKGIFETHLARIVSEGYRGKVAIRRVRIEMFESQVSPLLQEVMDKFPNAYLKAYVAMGDGTGLPVDVVVRGADGLPPNQELKKVLGFFAALAGVHGKSLEVID